MAAHGDLQELLRMFTSRKVSMMGAMGHIKALQAVKLKTIDQIAAAPLSDITAALKDDKLAKSFHTACKSHGKAGKRRSADEPESPSPKKQKYQVSKFNLDYSALTPDELEDTLTLPLEKDEALLRSTTIITNRAPLVLAFSAELLRITMPEQPPSSRLSLSQAVVSANSKTKAISLGIEAPGTEIPLSDGQPKVRVMGREIPVLKRAGYTWSGSKSPQRVTSPTSPRPQNTWSASQPITLKASTFVAHAIKVDSAAQRATLIKSLMGEKPDLMTADHNAWAVRTSFGGSPLVQEASFDDGESGCGKFLLDLMRTLDTTNTLIVLTRWYGGIMLGPDRWRLMRECANDALASMLRTSTLGGEPVWGLDTEDNKPVVSTVGMAIHRPEGARNYLLRSFSSAPVDGVEPKKTVAAVHEEKLENLAKLLGALRLLFESWQGVLTKTELDRRAWSWYVAVRPDVESGPSGWGAKGPLPLAKILDLRRTETEP